MTLDSIPNILQTTGMSPNPASIVITQVFILFLPRYFPIWSLVDNKLITLNSRCSSGIKYIPDIIGGIKYSYLYLYSSFKF